MQEVRAGCGARGPAQDSFLIVNLVLPVSSVILTFIRSFKNRHRFTQNISQTHCCLYVDYQNSYQQGVFMVEVDRKRCNSAGERT